MLIRIILSSLLLSLVAAGKTKITVPVTTTVSPNGKKIAFSWNEDLWQVSIDGGKASRLTTHPASEYYPKFTPDGKSLLFNSNRNGANQVFKKNLVTGAITQLTKHTETTQLQDISPNGKEFLSLSLRDGTGRNAMRFYSHSLDNPEVETQLFDTYGKFAKYSADGKKIIFAREGVQTYRKGYIGSQAGQIWIYDIKSKKFSQPVKSSSGVRSPLWSNKNNIFYYLSQQTGAFNLYRHNLTSGSSTQLTHYKDDGVIAPQISSDGTTILFRRLFDLYSLSTEENSKPKKIDIYHEEISHEETDRELILSQTKDIDFTESGLEIALTVNDDIHVMDTVLRDPIAITDTDEIESNLLFNSEDNALYYIKDDGITNAIYKVTRKDPSKFWWESNEFKHELVYENLYTISGFLLSPDGTKISIMTNDGKLIVTDHKGHNPILICKSHAPVYPQWSPDSKWLTFSKSDSNANSDIFIAKANGSEAPINISMHPDYEYYPQWSPDGKRLSFLGKMIGNSFDFYVVDLYQKEQSERAEKLEEAREAMAKDENYKTEEKGEAPKEEPKEKKKKKKVKGKEKEKSFHLENLSKRIQRVKISNQVKYYSWAEDSENLLVQFDKATAIQQIEIETGKESEFASATGPVIRVDKGNALYMINQEQPALVKKGKVTNYNFKVYEKLSKETYFKYAFRRSWRTMRDGFYDPALNNTDWDQALEKYEEVATSSVNSAAFTRIVSKMLGELNASHTGFHSKNWNPAYVPKRTPNAVVHLGVTFDSKHKGPGYKIQAILPGGPATEQFSKLEPGDIITKINDVQIKPNTPISQSLMLNKNKEISLTVKKPNKKTEEIQISPINYTEARKLAYEAEINHNEEAVSKLSEDSLGYIHISRMHWDEFEKFEHHIYKKGHGKDGIIIDIRDNSGGNIADHLLTILNQKRHAFTINRNGQSGYPQNRIVYATWDKPITILCNQNSYSNAEIFAHAIKSLNRGKLVGVRTAGGVISTSSKEVGNAGSIRYPNRGWFTLDGEDLEMNGAKPDVVVWSTPTDEVNGIDKQLEKAVEVLLKDVKEAPAIHQDPIYKSQR